MSWKFRYKNKDLSHKHINDSEKITSILEEQAKIDVPHIERKFHNVLEEQKEITYQRCLKIIDNYIEIEGEKLNGEVDIARHIKLLVRRIGNNVWHDFRNCREAYLQDNVYNLLAEPYKKLRETIVVDNPQMRDNIDQFERDFQYYQNLSEHLIEGWNEKMTKDRKKFRKHVIKKAKKVTSLPRILNERANSESSK